MAVIVETHHDENGIIWPQSVAPYDIYLMHLGKGEEAKIAAGSLYGSLREAGFAVAFDDRDVSAGVKFKDADLIGIPIRVAVGSRGLAQGNVEVKRRGSMERVDVSLSELIPYLQHS
jgi:prolyl-tRNA synthetase